MMNNKVRKYTGLNFFRKKVLTNPHIYNFYMRGAGIENPHAHLSEMWEIKDKTRDSLTERLEFSNGALEAHKKVIKKFIKFFATGITIKYFTCQNMEILHSNYLIEELILYLNISTNGLIGATTIRIIIEIYIIYNQIELKNRIIKVLAYK